MIRLVIEIEQESADFDQLAHFALDVESTVIEGGNNSSGMRVAAMTITDEFGGLVIRHEPDKVHSVDMDGRARTQFTSNFRPQE